MQRFMFLLILLIYKSTTTEAVTKTWTQNTNFDNPKNWNVGRLPCETDTISLPVNSPSILLQQPITTTSTIQLPLNGEVLLAEGSFIAAAPPTSSGGSSGGGTCEGQEVSFIRTESMQWLDPGNWQEGETGETPRLDTERVPCEFDEVLFPPQNTFLVALDSEIKVQSLTISGQTHTTQSLTQFLQTTQAKKQFNFTADANIEITNKKCKDVTGCACGNDKGIIMHKICELQTAKCPPVQCDSPITPRGHCCPVCGIVMTLDFAYGFKMKRLSNKINSNFFPDSRTNKEVYMILSKTSNERIQLVVLDSDNSGSQAKVRGNKIHDYIQDDINGPKKLGLTSIFIQESGESHSPSTGASKQRPFLHSRGSIAGLIISAIVVLLVIAAVMYCLVDRNQCRRHLPLSLPNPFRRFSSNSEKNALEMDDTVNYSDVMRSDDELNTFDNPMYNIPASGNNTPSVQELAKHKQAEAMMNNNDAPAILDPSSVTFAKSKDVGGEEGSTSFANPLFGSRKATNLTFIDPNLRLNPVFSEEGVEEDSHI